MPSCFQLTRKGEREAASLVKVDEHICEHFGVTPHPKKYYHDWYDVIGFLLATKDPVLGTPEYVAEVEKFLSYSADCEGFAEYRERMLAIVEFLAEHYTSNGWYEVKS